MCDMHFLEIFRNLELKKLREGNYRVGIGSDRHLRGICIKILFVSFVSLSKMIDGELRRPKGLAGILLLYMILIKVSGGEFMVSFRFGMMYGFFVAERALSAILTWLCDVSDFIWLH